MMNCIIYFLTDYYQKSLRSLAQTQADSYEEVLDKYKKIFISHLNYVKNKKCNFESCKFGCNNECSNLKEIIKNIDVNKIQDFFDTIKKIYINWIDAKTSDSLNELKTLLHNFKMIDFKAEDITKELFFKGRLSEQILTTWEMFHIPFNKRYLISNQRYSLTGQPLIYLGKLVIDVVEELEVSQEQLSLLKVSTFEIKENLRVYDLRNDIYNDVINAKIESRILGNDSKEIINEGKFFKNILSSICSFEKRKEHRNFSFCEEYVLPQVLAQTLKNELFHGIIYHSTKKFNNINFEISSEEDSWIQYIKRTKYKENVALFTHFNDEHVYDRNLYEKLTISTPIDIAKLNTIKMDDLKNIQAEINQTKKQDMISICETLLSKFDREFSQCCINEKKYRETNIGQLHIYHLYSIFNRILTQCNEEVK
ncbi:hypothetical protein OSC52_03515 [Clostridium pasteurianum]|uniref:hypothetical protein n=1 Tax=Clostridium pasteurianum TaxID=1501 RepID=UPI002260D039|nr:hypothetical protein [Clostridium pasteurianum]UZW14925.1 hypothetical protein OSC52_03515 [Clostridium pasteurianum]